MLNRLNKFRFQTGEKEGCVSCKSTLRIETDAVSPIGQFEKKWDDKSFAWIYGSEEMDSDPLIPKAIGDSTGLNICMVPYFFK